VTQMLRYCLLALLLQVNVDVAYAGPGRGNVVLAKTNVTRGDVLTAIPTDLCWVFEQHGAPSNNLEVCIYTRGGGWPVGGCESHVGMSAMTVAACCCGSCMAHQARGPAASSRALRIHNQGTRPVEQHLWVDSQWMEKFKLCSRVCIGCVGAVVEVVVIGGSSSHGYRPGLCVRIHWPPVSIIAGGIWRRTLSSTQLVASSQWPVCPNMETDEKRHLQVGSHYCNPPYPPPPIPLPVLRYICSWLQ
jgi:hypothetical protein